MKTKKLTFAFICLICLCISCDSSIEENNLKSDMEQLLIKNWQFVYIEVNEVRTYRVSQGFEPGSRGAGFGGWIPWFWFGYHDDLSYDFRSDATRFYLGYEENYQPEYGYWELEEDRNLLIHNSGMPYEKTYRIIQLNDTSFIREYERIVYQSFDTIAWPIGEVATYREFLQVRE